jgi:hypothetical protein
MKRTVIQFDDETYQKVKQRAFDQERSMSSVVRELVAKGLDGRKRKKPTRAEQFSFVGAGRSRQGALAPVSERHDEALAEVRFRVIRKN